MKILLVEDDAYKQERIEALLRREFADTKLLVARSVRDAVSLMREQIYDFIILDIALPSHSFALGGSSALPMPSGGVEILLEISYDQRSDKVIIITQYPEIELEKSTVPLNHAKSAIEAWLNVDVSGVVHFDVTDSNWEASLLGAMRV